MISTDYIKILEQTKKSRTNTFGLSIFRSVVGFLIIKNVIFFYPVAEAFFGPKAIYPLALYRFFLSRNNIDFLYFPFHIEGASKVFLILMLIVGVAFFFGIFKRLSGIILYYFVLTLTLRNEFILDGSDNVLYVFTTLPYCSSLLSFLYNELF